MKESNDINIKGNGNTAILGNGNTVNTIKKEEALIRIVDISIDEDGDDDGFPILDIKLRNTGDTAAFIKALRINVFDYFDMQNPNITEYERIESTYTYDVLLTGYKSQVHHISQCVKANDVDRFQVKLASSHEEPNVPNIYEISVTIVYNETGQEVESDRKILPIPSIENCAGYYISKTSMEIARMNYYKLKEIYNKRINKSKKFMMIYESYERNKEDFI